jgi:hypothetical protein
VGTQLRVQFTVRDLRFLNKALDGLGEQVRTRALKKGLRAGGQVLLHGVRRRMPVDTGTARDALHLKAWSNRRRGKVGILVLYDTDRVLANSPPYQGDPRGAFFYPAVIEYGSVKLHRKPVAPMRRTEEGDGPRAILEVIAVVEAEVDKLTKKVEAAL